MDGVQCFEGDGVDAEAIHIARVEYIASISEDLWSVIDYLDEFNHVIEANQWHVNPVNTPDHCNVGLERRSTVDDFRRVLAVLYTDAKAGRLNTMTIKTMHVVLTKIVALNGSDSFSKAAFRVRTMMSDWVKELIDEGITTHHHFEP